MIIRQWERGGALSDHSSSYFDSLIRIPIIALLFLTTFSNAIPNKQTDSPVSSQQQLLISENAPPVDIDARPSTYTAMVDALEAMEAHFFEVSRGTWPQAIDWTAALMGTQVSATLSAMTQYHTSLHSIAPPSSTEARDQENLINRYFTQISSFYFGENAFSLRNQAYDDMLWVVLGWLEAIQFIHLHSKLHYTSPQPSTVHEHTEKSNHSWYAHQFVPQYAHRARLFYDLASRGWDTSLCGGGMTWNPYLAPYKNAITNQLYIAASVGMYLYFPGDRDASPYSTSYNQGTEETSQPPAEAHDLRYLENAISAYIWLNNSGMKNTQGLYTDGFHIKGWRFGDPGSNGTSKCDVRNEKVYTYNQGVILSGLRGLYIATGTLQYLRDGHDLIHNVISATGWQDRDTRKRWQWAGLGRGGILEEACDWSGTCSQNGQTFKGIFFHHLTIFCTPLPHSISPECEHGEDEEDDDSDARFLHQRSCEGYGEWIRHNAHAASVTRDEDGIFGGWWGRPSSYHRRRRHDDDSLLSPDDQAPSEQTPSTSTGTDYRNLGVPHDQIWQLSLFSSSDSISPSSSQQMKLSDLERPWNEDKINEKGMAEIEIMQEATSGEVKKQDINDRGRGRTVETQSGGLAVLRASWVLGHQPQQHDTR